MIKKLSQDVHTNKMRNKLLTNKKKHKEEKELAEFNNRLNFPFKINTIVKKDLAEIQSPLLLEVTFKNAESKFTPKLERYMEMSEGDRRGKVRNSFEKIRLQGEISPQRPASERIQNLGMSPKKQ